MTFRLSFGAALIFSFVLAHPARAGAPPTLEQICGPPDNIIKGTIFTEKCYAAYASGNASLIENNNTYVHGAAAVVCAYSCMAGGFGSCGAGGGACSGAVSLGNKAVADDQDSTNGFSSAQKNGSDALALMMGQNKNRDFIGSANTGQASVPSLPSSCTSAASTRSVSARIDCAAATDPSLPAFVRSPQFASEFKDITGYTLQDAFSQDTATLLNQYGPSAIKNAYAKVKGKISYADFMKSGNSIMGGIMAKLDPGKQADFAANLEAKLPRKELSASASATDDQAKDQAKDQAHDQVRDEAVTAADLALASPQPADRAPALEPASAEDEEKQGLDLFQRISLGYRRAVRVGRVE
jgi:hypothetical protein